MRLRSAVRLATVTLGLSALVPSGAAAASPVPHSPAPRVGFRCPSASICVFPHDNYTGNYGAPWNGPGIIDANAVADDTWYKFSARNLRMSHPNPGSITNKTTSCVWLYSRSRGKLSIKEHTRKAADHKYGYIYVDFRHGGCRVVPHNPR
jgi:hypothetical protein